MAPTLLVWGDEDQVPVATRSAQEQLQQAIPNAQLLIYAGAGHSAHWERPERFASDLATLMPRRSPVRTAEHPQGSTST